MSAAIDVVVVTYRSEKHIAACLQAVRSVVGIARIVVVDHGDGEAGRRAAALGAEVVHDPSNPGFGKGQNRGVAIGESPYILLLNPDAVVLPEAISRGLAILDARPDVAAVQGAIVNSATGRLERSQGRELGPVHLLGRALALRALLQYAPVRAVTRRIPAVADHVDRAPHAVTETEWLAATAVLMRRSAFEQVGGFSDDYFMYGEDVDLCHRLRTAGWQLLAIPDEWARHQSGASAPTSVDRELIWWNGTLIFAARWWSRRAWCLGLLAAALEGLRLSVRSPGATRRIARSLLVSPLRSRRLRKTGP